MREDKFYTPLSKLKADKLTNIIGITFYYYYYFDGSLSNKLKLKFLFRFPNILIDIERDWIVYQTSMMINLPHTLKSLSQVLIKKTARGTLEP